MNVTAPDGVPAPGAIPATAAVNVTDCPKTDGLRDDVTVVMVSARLTACDRVEDVLAVKFESPAYVAVIACAPTASDAAVNVAVPALSVAVPSVVAPSLNVTSPVGIPEPGAVTATAAVNVTDWPSVDVFRPDAMLVVVLACVTAWEIGAPDPLAPLMIQVPNAAPDGELRHDPIARRIVRNATNVRRSEWRAGRRREGPHRRRRSAARIEAVRV